MVNDSQNISAQASLFSGAATGDVELQDNKEHDTCAVDEHRSSEGGRSFIDTATLKQLRRELDQEVIDSEFNPKVCENLNDMHKYMSQFITDDLKKKSLLCQYSNKKGASRPREHNTTQVQLLATPSFWLVFKDWAPLGLNKYVKLITE